MSVSIPEWWFLGPAVRSSASEQHSNSPEVTVGVPIKEQLAGVGLECKHPERPCSDSLCKVHGDPQLVSSAEYLRLVRIEHAAVRARDLLRDSRERQTEYDLLREVLHESR